MITLEYLDHMFREQSYYLLKIGANIPNEQAIQGFMPVETAMIRGRQQVARSLNRV